MRNGIRPGLAVVAAGVLCASLACAGLAAAPARAASTPSTPLCMSKPNDADCDGVSSFQADGQGTTCRDSAYPVPGNDPDTVYYTQLNELETYSVTLWYSTKCGTNWAEVDALGNGDSGVAFAAKVRRAGNANAGYLMEHGGPDVLLLAGETGTAYSPMVYAPHNEAQACLSLPPFSGSPDQIACTNYH
jgi:hypothetical protein